jgi:XTP/dITP diphosphohydrolase
MRTIYFITGNESKFREARLVLDDLKNVRLRMKKIDIPEIQSIDQGFVVTDKAEKAYELLRRPLIVDDSGIYFQAYHNFPGVYSKHLFETLDFKGLERLLKGVTRKAYFKSLICYKDSKTTEVFEGIWSGSIAPNASNVFNKDWPYDSIFIPIDEDIPVSEMPLEEKAKISHRRRALDKFKKYLLR